MYPYPNGWYGQQYNTHHAQTRFEEAFYKAGANKAMGIHDLRHRFIPRPFGNRADVRFNQEKAMVVYLIEGNILWIKELQLIENLNQSLRHGDKRHVATG